MSASGRRIVETYSFPTFQAQVLSTRALQLFYTEVPGKRVPNLGQQPGLHIATVNGLTSTMEKRGWVAELLLGLMELFSHPATVTRVGEPWAEPGRLTIELNEHLNGLHIETIMESD